MISKNKEELLESILFLAALILAIIYFCLCYFDILTKESDIKKYQSLYEWESVELEGYCWFGCGNTDFFQTKFKAKKNEKEINGCVCSSFLKNTTLRLN
jgi:hypothetical protein